MAATPSIHYQSITPYSDQKPGTSGLRKRVAHFKQESYVESFVESLLLAAQLSPKSTFVLSGDGRYMCKDVGVIVLRMLAAHDVARVVIGQDFLMSTPAVSECIRSERADGGIILTASHNPGGPNYDFGIKYNCANGGPAPSALTDKAYEISKNLTEYKIWSDAPENVDWSSVGTFTLGNMSVEIIDAPRMYCNAMSRIFDFDALRAFVARQDARIVLDGMHGVAGPFLRHVFVETLQAGDESVINATPLEDFGGGHPDPNFVHAHELVTMMGMDENGELVGDCSNTPYFGAAFDGDADRNMILGRGFFMSPSDSLAVITANCRDCIPYFRNGISGVARSMPTSNAVDMVAKRLGIKCYEVPTGWKYFGNLMDAKKIALCGEESFGTGSDHVREKDGIWASLAWLSILAYKNKDVPTGGKLVSLEDVAVEHWGIYGRNYHCRYDYEHVDAGGAKSVMAHLLERSVDDIAGLQVRDEFSYLDPVDGSQALHQGIRFLFKDGSRFVFRLSGTGSVGATIRLYVEKYDANEISLKTNEALKPLIDLALKVSRLKHFVGRTTPDVVTSSL